MLSFDSRKNLLVPNQRLPFRHEHIVTTFPWIWLEEEEEERVDFTWISDWSIALESWWSEFSARHKFPLYCIILATEADKDVALYLEDHRSELSAISGDGCCFVYFRDIERAKRLKPFRFAEHAKGVLRLLKGSTA